jgi:protein tyrosine/serine phosphatase
LVIAPPARAQFGKDWLKPELVHEGLWRGRAPYRHRHYEQIKPLGVRTILDIRGNQPLASTREQRQAEQHGLEYRHVPMGFRPLRDGSGDRVIAAMQDVSAYPMYVHCNIDRDRTSAVIGVYRIWVQGWNPEAAEREARSFGIRRYFVGLNRYLRAAGG